MTQLLCIDDSGLNAVSRWWWPKVGSTYTPSIIIGDRVSLMEDTFVVGHPDVGINGNNTFADGRFPFRSSRFVDITGIEESAEVSEIIYIGERK